MRRLTHKAVPPSMRQSSGRLRSMRFPPKAWLIVCLGSFLLLGLIGAPAATLRMPALGEQLLGGSLSTAFARDAASICGPGGKSQPTQPGHDATCDLCCPCASARGVGVPPSFGAVARPDCQYFRAWQALPPEAVAWASQLHPQQPRAPPSAV